MIYVEISPKENVLTIDGVKYRFHIGTGCRYCFFLGKGICASFPCSPAFRKDKKDGFFVEVKPK